MFAVKSSLRCQTEQKPYPLLRFCRAYIGSGGIYNIFYLTVSGSQAENKENLTAVPEPLDMDGVSMDKENICNPLNTAVPTTSAADTSPTGPVISTEIHGSMPVTSLSEEEELEREKLEMYRGMLNNHW